MMTGCPAHGRPDLERLVREAREDFHARFDRLPQWTTVAPGRVNLIGDHTDYNDGYCLPFAINRYTVICAAAASEHAQTIELFSANTQQSSWIELTQPIAKVGDWSDYARGVMNGYQELGVDPLALKISCYSNLPVGAGLSSSASFEVATAHLLETINNMEHDSQQMIRLCQQAEHQYAGVPCGLLDQFAVTMAQAGHMMRFDSRSLSAEQVAFGGDDMALLVINSKVEHSLGDGEYATRRSECEAAVEKLGHSLRDANLASLERLPPAGSVLYRRARHVITENDRVLRTATLLQDRNWRDAGELMYASHASLRDDYQVSCDETDMLVAIAAELGVAGGVYGARMTGGGFGGSVIALARQDSAENVAQQMRGQYLAQTGIELDYLAVHPVRGAHVVEPDS